MKNGLLLISQGTWAGMCAGVVDYTWKLRWHEYRLPIVALYYFRHQFSTHTCPLRFQIHEGNVNQLCGWTYQRVDQ